MGCLSPCAGHCCWVLRASHGTGAGVACQVEGRGHCGCPRPCSSLSPKPVSPQCSVTCGKGYKQRLVSCSEIYTGKENYEYGHQTATNCPGMQPPSVHPCYLRDCPISATWRVGNWGSVSRWLSYQITKLWDPTPHLQHGLPAPCPTSHSPSRRDPAEKGQ